MTLSRTQLSQFSKVNNLLYNWYLLAVQKNMYPDGSLHISVKKQRILQVALVTRHQSLKRVAGKVENQTQ
jgi:hypothetical protein